MCGATTQQEQRVQRNKQDSDNRHSGAVHSIAAGLRTTTATQAEPHIHQCQRKRHLLRKHHIQTLQQHATPHKHNNKTAKTSTSQTSTPTWHTIATQAQQTGQATTQDKNKEDNARHNKPRIIYAGGQPPTTHTGTGTTST